MLWSKTQITEKLRDKVGVFTTGGERIDAEVLAGCPHLKICANMAVGYNNFDLDAMTAARVLGTNAPDVLTETTADFGFALLMATARRISESEHFLRAGHWTRWSYGMFAGADVHGSTLGIIGMGRIGQGIARRGALGFGMKVVYHNRSRLDAAIETECRASYVSKAELLKTLELAPGETAKLAKRLSLAEMTTRKHYPGTHRVDVILNGQPQPLGAFELVRV